MNTKNSQKTTSASSDPSAYSDNFSPDSPVQLPEELNINEWRRMVSDMALKLRSGETSPVVANSFANLMGKVTQSYKLQLDYARALGKTPDIDALMPGKSETH